MTSILSAQHSPHQNQLLAALPHEVFKRIAPHLKLCPMALGQTLYESSGQLNCVYFPTTAIVVMHYIMVNGASAAIAAVGNEGVLGVSVFMGGKSISTLATVQTAGYSYRLKGAAMMAEFNRAGSMMRLMLRYPQTLINQVSQTALCNRFHSVEQQLCRWLLLTIDRLPSNELTITQELIAGSLGVRREGITEAAGNLQHAGFISYRRGHINILDRSGLESLACECYNAAKKEYLHLLLDAKNCPIIHS